MDVTIVGYLHANGIFSTDKALLHKNLKGDYEKIIIILSKEVVADLVDKFKTEDGKVIS